MMNQLGVLMFEAFQYNLGITNFTCTLYDEIKALKLAMSNNNNRLKNRILMIKNILGVLLKSKLNPLALPQYCNEFGKKQKKHHKRIRMKRVL